MQNKPYRGKNTRQYYRIRYPRDCRPKITILGVECDVIEVSERGVRFLYNKTIKLQTGMKVQVKITFYDGESFDLEGETLRIDEGNVIIRFSEGIPLYKILKEQIYIKMHYVGYI